MFIFRFQTSIMDFIHSNTVNIMSLALVHFKTDINSVFLAMSCDENTIVVSATPNYLYTAIKNSRRE